MKYLYLNSLLILSVLVISSCFCSSRQRRASSRTKVDPSKSVITTPKETPEKEGKQEDVHEVIKEIREFREVSEVIEIRGPAKKKITTSTYPQITIERLEEESTEKEKETNKDQNKPTEEEINQTKDTNGEHEENNYLFSDDEVSTDVNESTKKKVPKMRSLCIKIKRICDPCLGEESMCTCNSEDCINRRRLNKKSASKEPSSKINTLYTQQELRRSSRTPSSTVHREVVVYRPESRVDEGIYSDTDFEEEEEEVGQSRVHTERMRAMRIRSICNKKKLLILFVTLILGYLTFFLLTMFPMSTAFMTSGYANNSLSNKRFSDNYLYPFNTKNQLSEISALTKWKPLEELYMESSGKRRIRYGKSMTKHHMENKLKEHPLETKQIQTVQPTKSNNKNWIRKELAVSYFSNPFFQMCPKRVINDPQAKKESPKERKKRRIHKSGYYNKKELPIQTNSNQSNHNKKLIKGKKNTCPYFRKHYGHFSSKNKRENNFPQNKEERQTEVEKENKLEKNEQRRNIQNESTDLKQNEQKLSKNKKGSDKKGIEIYVETNEPKIRQLIQNYETMNSLTNQGNVHINEKEPNSKNSSGTKVLVILPKLPSEMNTNNSLSA